MRISDWSSDVCSSDLLEIADRQRAAGAQHFTRGAQAFSRRRADKIEFVFDRQDIVAIPEDRVGRIAARHVGNRTNHAAMKESILLTKISTERQIENHLAVADVDHLGPD